MGIQEWAETRVNEITRNIMGLVDGGLDIEDAIENQFNQTTLGEQYRQQVLKNVEGYQHTCTSTLDVITGKMWCPSCQKFIA